MKKIILVITSFIAISVISCTADETDLKENDSNYLLKRETHSVKVGVLNLATGKENTTSSKSKIRGDSKIDTEIKGGVLN